MIIARLDQHTAKTLMRALCVVVSHVLADEFSQVRLTQRDDAVEAFLFDRADETFDERVQVGAAKRQANRLRSVQGLADASRFFINTIETGVVDGGVCLLLGMMSKSRSAAPSFALIGVSK